MSEVCVNGRGICAEFLDLLSEGILIVREGQLLYANSSAVRLLGYQQAEDWGQQALSNLVMPAEWPKLRAHLEDGRNADEYRLTWLLRDGSALPLSVRQVAATFEAQPCVLLYLHGDVRRSGDPLALASDAPIREFAERCGEVIFTIDADGFFVYISPAVETLTGYAPDEFIGQPHAPFHAPSSIALSEEAFARVMAGEAICGLELEVPCKTGGTIWMEFNVAPIWQESDVVGLQGSARVIDERKRADLALRQGEMVLRQVLDANPSMIFVRDAEGRYLLANHATSALYDLEPDTLVGMPLAELVARGALTQEAADRIRQRDAQVIATGQRLVIPQDPFELPDGQRRWYQITLMPTTFRGQTDCILGTAVDVTECVVAEQAANYERDLLRALMDSIPDAIFFKDTSSRFVRINRTLANQFGLADPNDVIGKTDADFYGPEHAAQSITDDRWMIAMRRPILDKTWHRLRPDGTSRWVSANSAPVIGHDGQVLGVVGIVRDTTERRRALEALRESEERFRSAFDAAPIGMALVSEDGRFLRANQAFGQMLGYTADELLNMEWPSLIHRDDRLRSSLFLDELRSGRRPRAQWETRLLHRQSAIRWVLVTVSLIRDEEGRPWRFILQAQDITERKRAERARLADEARTQLLLRLTQVRDAGVPELLQQAMEEALRLTGSALGYIGEVDDDLAEMHVLVWSAGVAPRCRLPDDDWMSLHAGGLWADAYHYRRPTVVNDYATLCLSRNELPEGHPTLARFASVPVFDGETIVALVCVANKNSPYDDEDSRQLSLLMENVWRVVERTRAEEALRQSEQRYRAYVNNAPDGVFVMSAEGCLVRVNEAGCRLVGYASEELLQLALPQLLARESQEEGRLVLDNARTEGKAAADLTLQRKDGTLLYVALSVAKVAEDEYLAICTDIGERRAAAEELRRRNEDLYLINALNQAASNCESREQILTLLVSELQRMLGCQAVAVFLADEPGDKLELRQEALTVEMDALLTEKLGGLGYTFQSLIDKGLWLEPLDVWKEGPRILPDSVGSGANIGKLVGGPAVTPEMRRRLASAIDSFSLMLVPLLDGDQPVAVVSAVSGEQSFTPDDLRRVQVILDQLHATLIRQRSEELLRHSERRYRALFDKASDGILVYDLDGRLLEANPQACRALGYEHDELLAMRFEDIVGHEVRPFVAEHIRQSRQHGSASFETSFMRRDGSVFPVEVVTQMIEFEGRPAVSGSARDLSERLRAEQMLRDSEATARVLLNMGYDQALLVSTDGTIIAANDVACRFLQIPSSQVRGSCLYDLLPNELVASWRVWIEHAIETQEPVQHEEENGGRLLDHRVYPLLGADGQVEKLALFAHDLTEHRRLEDQARQTHKMEAVGRLAGGVAHDFNNLLTVINGYSEVILNGLDPADPMRQDAEQVLRAGKRGAELTRQLLAFSRRQVLDTRLLNLNDVLEGMAKMLGRIMGEDIRLDIQLAPEIHTIKADPGQLESVVVNLAANARDAMPGGGVLTIRTENVSLDAATASRYPGASPGNYVLLSMADTGSGMSAEVKAHLFEPFFTTKDRGRGTGLGLATVFGIVTQSGGFLDVDSELGRGTDVRIYLPEVVGDPNALPMVVDELDLPHGDETILVVEDQEEVRRLTVRMLRTLGYRVLQAPNGSTALYMLQTSDDPAHLVLTDVVMPEMSGREFIERLRQIRHGFKVLYMSGYTDDVIAQHGLDDLGADLIQKPFTIGKLAMKVREVLDRPD